MSESESRCVFGVIRKPWYDPETGLGRDAMQSGTYKKFIGENNTWYVKIGGNLINNIWVDLQEDGETIIGFPLDDGTVDCLKGPSNSNSGSFQRDVGMDVHEAMGIEDAIWVQVQKWDFAHMGKEGGS